MGSSYSDSEKEEIIYQFLDESAKEKGKHYCSACGGSYSFDNIYMCRKCIPLLLLNLLYYDRR